MKIHPAGHRVLVKLKKTESETVEKTKSGIITAIKSVNEIEREQYATTDATVVELGHTAFKAFDDGKAWCKVGDTVIIAKYSGIDRKLDNGDILRIVVDEDIIGVVEHEEC